MTRIEPGDGFIHNQDFRFPHDCAGQHGAGEFTAGQRGRDLVAFGSEIAQI